jgi:hypothetical protein
MKEIIYLRHRNIKTNDMSCTAVLPLGAHLLVKWPPMAENGPNDGSQGAQRAPNAGHEGAQMAPIAGPQGAHGPPITKA